MDLQNLKFIILAIVITIGGCKSSSVSMVESISGSNLKLDLIVPDGEFVPSSTNANTWVVEAREQMKYTVGTLAAMGGVVDIDRLRVSVNPIDSTSKLVKYMATVPVAMQGDRTVPGSFPLMVPEKVDSESIRAFASRYKDCASAQTTTNLFWYHFSAVRDQCPLKQMTRMPGSLRLTGLLVQPVSDVANKRLYPEYHQLWGDQTLKIHLARDAEYFSDSLVQELIEHLDGSYPRIKNTEAADYLWQLDETRKVELVIGPLTATAHPATDVIILLAADASFSVYNELSVRQSRAKKYRMYLVSGVSSKAIVDQRIYRSPVSGITTKYVDVLLAGQSDPNMNSIFVPAQVLHYLIEGKKSYHEFKTDLGKYVDIEAAGHEDNSWPKPFDEGEGFSLWPF